MGTRYRARPREKYTVISHLGNPDFSSSSRQRRYRSMMLLLMMRRCEGNRLRKGERVHEKMRWNEM